jgi:LmbE family N-acetylglucosaminyl deacetylase
MVRRGLRLAALLGSAAFSAAATTVAVAAPALPQMTAFNDRDRILVVAPHPDDESLCCAGLLQQALARGASVGVVWITAGDGFELDAMLAERSVALGVPRKSQYQLGYPDRGVLALCGDYYARPYRSTYTAVNAVPYAGVLSPGASYTGANLESDLEHVLALFRPTLVLAAAPQDRHPDHSASGALVRRLLTRRGELGELRYWIVHAPDWPRPLGLEPDAALMPPDSAAALAWQSMPLSEPQRLRKLAALRDHRSQMRLLAPFMESFVRANEIFAPAP